MTRREVYPDTFECEIVDIWTEQAVWPFNQFVPSYKVCGGEGLRVVWVSGWSASV